MSSRSGCFRKPVRLTITMPNSIFQDLERLSFEQGRSLSNLAAHLLEVSLKRFSPNS
jgi:hypothetical protein